jgi:hypothetical protein
MVQTRFAIGMQRMSFQQQDILLEPYDSQHVYHQLRIQKITEESSRSTFAEFVMILTRPFLGLVPWLGYHHVLMLLNAVAIILLCTSSSHIPLT